jgi:hypothetical protein
VKIYELRYTATVERLAFIEATNEDEARAKFDADEAYNETECELRDVEEVSLAEVSP